MRAGLNWAMLAVGCAAALCGAASALGQPLTADEFEQITTGKTFYFSRDGQSYGAEQYLPGRKVIWAFTGDDCRKGYWYPQGANICFVNEDKAEPQCWEFSAGTGGLEALFQGGPDEAPLFAKRSSPEPMACLGPDVGV